MLSHIFAYILGIGSAYWYLKVGHDEAIHFLTQERNALAAELAALKARFHL